MRLSLLPVLVALLAKPAWAQSFGGIDANGLPASASPSPYFALPASRGLEAGDISVGLRTSLLLRPLTGNQPSPSASGTSTDVLSWLVLGEVLGAVGLGAGFDLALALPLHVAQAGQGLTGIGVGAAPSSAAFGDPRVTLGYQIPWREADLRLFSTLFVPFGQEQDFAGERMVRGDFGASVDAAAGDLHLGASVAFRARESSEIGDTRWASQVILGLAVRTRLEGVDWSLETVLSPTLVEQPTPLGGRPGYLLPAEVILGAQLDAGPVRLGVFGGTGIPLTLLPRQDGGGGGFARGPTSPTLRLGIDARAKF